MEVEPQDEDVTDSSRIPEDHVPSTSQGQGSPAPENQNQTERLIFREWTPLTCLMEKIPTKAQKGLTILDLKLTCLDALEDFIAIGTNVGLIYLYNRRDDTLQRLKLEVSTSPITCVKLVSSEDLMLAAGNIAGYIVVFQIPKEHDNKIHQAMLSEDAANPKKKQIQRFDIKGLHTTVISTLEWSTNGMKLFSGDRCGAVVLTEIDYDVVICRSYILLDEKYNIVQLSYSHLQLLISSTFRSIIYSTEDKQIHKIGTQERKTLGHFGAVFEPGLWKKNHKIYTARPGLRLWIANLEGAVEQTIIFKDLMANPETEIPVINPTSVKQKLTPADLQFGTLYNFMNRYLVTCVKDVLYIIDPIQVRVLGSCGELKSIHSLSVYRNEIFVLESDRSIVRISNINEDFIPPSPHYSKKPSNQRQFQDLMTASFNEFLPKDSLAQWSSKFKKTTENFKSSNLLSTIKNVIEPTEDVEEGIPTDNYHSTSDEMNEEFSVESPFIPPPPPPPPIDKFADISKLSFENVVCISERKSKSKKKGIKSTSKMQPGKPILPLPIAIPIGEAANEVLSDSISVSSFSTNSEREETTENSPHPVQPAIPIQRKSSLESIQSNRSASTSGEASNGASSASDNHLTNLENVRIFYEQNTTREDVESKEEMLAHKLNWSELLPESSKSVILNSKSFPKDTQAGGGVGSVLSDGTDKSASLLTLTNEKFENDLESSEELRIINMASVDLKEWSDSTLSASSSKEIEGRLPSAEENLMLDQIDELLKQNKGSDQSNSSGSFSNKSLRSNLSFGPPSGSSQTAETKSLLENIDEIEKRGEEEMDPFNVEVNTAILDMEVDAKIVGKDNWLEYKLPCSVVQIASCSSYILCVDSKGGVYSSEIGVEKPSLHWIKADFKANGIALASDGSVVWRIENGTLYKLLSPSRQGPFSTNIQPKLQTWIPLHENVAYCAVEINLGIIILTDGKLKMTHTPNSPEFEPMHTPRAFKSISILNKYTFGLSVDGKVFYAYRKPLSETLEWEELFISAEIEPSVVVSGICLGPCNSLWIFDSSNHLYVLEIPAYNMLQFWDGNRCSTDNIWTVSLSELITSQFGGGGSPPTAGSPKNWTFKITQTLKPVPEKLMTMLHLNKGPILAGSDNLIMFTFPGSTSIQINKKCVIGFRWDRILFEGGSSLTWRNVFGESIYQTFGYIWLLNPKGKLCFCGPSGGKIQTLELPCTEPIVSISAAPETLWILNSKGQIFARRNMNCRNPLGIDWGRIDTSHIDKVHLVHITCGSEIAWACDNEGKIYMRVGLLEPTGPTDSHPAWFPVEDPNNIFFTKVHVGTFRHMVFALDNARNVYLREGIFPELPIGTSWLKISGIEATKLTISDKALYILGPKGEIFRRYGISEMNPAGDHWKKIFGSATVITASVSDDLWCLDGNGYLNKLAQRMLRFGNECPKRKLDEEDCDWEIV